MISTNDPFGERSTLDLLTEMQNGLVSRATGSDFTAEFGSGNSAYRSLRSQILERQEVQATVPYFVRDCRDLDQFWQSIKHAFGSYRDRREFLWNSFRPAIEALETFERSPNAAPISEALERFDPHLVAAYWKKALDRRSADPEGAITAARSLLESTCKHVLDAVGEPIDESADLPRLWAQCAEKLNLAPQQHQEKVFKSILGSCQTIVNSLGSIRNKIGDAHGNSPLAVKPKPRHAELAVNLAGAMASFLVATLSARSGEKR